MAEITITGEDILFESMVIQIRRKTSEINLKMTASMNVKAGVRLLIAEARVGEL